MATVERLTHRFVEFIPADLEDGVIYVSLTYTTMIHLCACGCRTKVVCVLSPTDYAMTYNGETVSIWPSIGNWDFHCRSHYVIRNGDVRWALDMSAAEIAAGRRRDRAAKEARAKTSDTSPEERFVTPIGNRFGTDSQTKFSIWRRAIDRITGRLS